MLFVIFCFLGEEDLDDWRQVEVNLGKSFKNLVIEAWIGERTYNFDSSYGDICVDDVEILNGGCQKQLTIYGENFPVTSSISTIHAPSTSWKP